ncbi:MAG TPA: hypothetical protein VHR66_17700 [Gemmataceae bacterium]|jgi:hypothetical protein|nr:hypothetical protein [Gemmataceae bacterium]
MTLRVICGITLALVSIGAGPPPLVEIRNAGDSKNRIEARAELDTGTVRLSGEVKLTLTVEGPEPLSVTTPKAPVTRPNTWRVRDDGLPLREILGGGRALWKQVYRLSPLAVGDQQIALAPLIVRAGDAADITIAWDAEKLPSVRVVSVLENPSVESLRPATDIELLPPDPIDVKPGHGWVFAIVPCLLTLSAVGILLGRRKRRHAIPRDSGWAIAQMTTGSLTPDRCAHILRQYLSYRFAVPAEFETTPELAARLIAEQRLPADVIAELQSFLSECDAARFSGTSATVSELADRARALIELTERRIQERLADERKAVKT